MKIENFDEQLPGSPIIAYFDVYIPAWQLTFRRLKLIRTKKGSVFIAIPNYMKEVNGEKKYFPYIEFSPEKEKDFKAKVSELLKPFSPGGLGYS